MNEPGHHERFAQASAEHARRTSPVVCYELDPTQDPRWPALVDGDAGASVFHSVGWLRALRETYGYDPVVLTTSPPGEELKNGVVFCRVRSILTGRRLVSLPFSDHCEPLFASGPDLAIVIRHLQSVFRHEGWKYFEVRAVREDLGQSIQDTGCVPAGSYFLHMISLRPDLNEIFHRLDRDSVQRRIERADRAGLTEKCGSSKELLADFYSLFVTTRRRHRIPPSPYAWFQNLIKNQESALEIRVAYKEETPIAGILTLQFKDNLYYKYGGSDARFNRFGATPWLFWRAITAAKARGIQEFDLGRTGTDEEGLLAFKNHWDPHPRRLFYLRYPAAGAMMPLVGRKLKIAERVFALMPERLLRMVGAVLYRHIG
jgi:hypothetical protein